jgi:hypothetical protein
MRTLKKIFLDFGLQIRLEFCKKSILKLFTNTQVLFYYKFNINLKYLAGLKRDT